MERATYTTKSFIIAIALVEKRLTVEQAARAAQAEVNSQIERWGEVEDSKCPFWTRVYIPVLTSIFSSRCRLSGYQTAA